MNRRLGIGIALAVLVLSSGCLGFLSGPVTFSASKATVSENALSETGYEKARIQSNEVTRTFSVVNQSKNVTVTNWISMYERSVDLPLGGNQRAAVFSAFTTPEVSVLGQSFNPVEKYSNRELAALAQKQYGSLSVGNAVGNRTVEMLNQSATVTKFEGQATLKGGQSVDVYVHVTKVNHGSDYVVAVAIYPQRLDGEQQKVDALLKGLQHDSS
ncbi:DUF6517 family protein [Halobacterium zhouii]|uniref:DUF6517 family protein n=1 Tax=Halobacterium zhouii TaxID=2902624 RepID=UPI001E638412|nr:DUF6517 family protein [Halobacterium zhouii]